MLALLLAAASAYKSIAVFHPEYVEYLYIDYCYHLATSTFKLIEGENTTFQLWCDLYARIIARDENRPLDEIKTKEVLEKYPIPAGIDFRMGEYEVH